MGHADRFRYPGLRTEVEVRCGCGHPRVLRCHPLMEHDGRRAPFPTLFWLACDDVVKAVSALEHDGLITRLQERIATDPALRARVHADHDAYRAERWAALDDEERAWMVREGIAESARSVGIGGIRNPDSVKCLHLHFAHHLARGSAIGALIEEHLEGDVCRGPARSDG